MITAKNYAAHAYMAFKDAANITTDNKAKTILRQISHTISESVHFVIPDGGKIFNDKFKGLNNQQFKLPYNALTIEYLGKDKEGYDVKCCMLFVSYGTNMAAYCAASDGNKWIASPLFGIIEGVPDLFNLDNLRHKIKIKYINIYNKPLPEKMGVMAAASIGGCFGRLFELLEALSCRNVATINYQEASSANVKRNKAGKLPFYETKMLVIDTHYSVSGKTHNVGGSHASPRQHLRRGHIRRLEIGNIWVNSCVVGDPTKGRIDKQYSVV